MESPKEIAHVEEVMSFFNALTGEPMSIDDQNLFELTISAAIRDVRSGLPALELRETVRLSTYGFLELAKVLGRFHDLALELRKDTELRGK